MQKILILLIFLNLLIIPKAFAEKFNLWCFAEVGGTMIFKFDLDNNKVDQFTIDKSSNDNIVKWVSLVDTDRSIIFKAYFVEANLKNNITKMYIDENFDISKEGVLKAMNQNNLFKFLSKNLPVLKLDCER